MEVAAYQKEDFDRIELLCDEISQIVALNKPADDAVANAIIMNRIFSLCSLITCHVQTPYATKKVQELRALANQGYGVRASAYTDIPRTIRILAHGILTAARAGR